MTELVVRRLLVDLAEPFPRLWNGGDAFRTAWFNALSMSFPVGEQFFIDAVRRGLERLPAAQREAMEPELRAFIGQEATHRQVHTLFNRQLEAQGHVNRWAPRALQRIRRLEGLDARAWVAATAATEHVTALLADWMLRHPEALDGAPAGLQALWSWHAAEESEHRSSAFDLYAALGGNLLWRRRFMRLVSWHFCTDVWRQTLRNLHHDRALWKMGTWRSAWRLLLARDGLLRSSWRPWRDYFRADFHPRQHDDGQARRWLREHPEIAVPVRS
ncbi:MAG: metal-dependent hydrolase [Piscinibacter sp.]|nr:metal-dependent hydrolase [Piscinibacter sp.]